MVDLATAAEGITDAINRDAAEARGAGEPEWLRNLRLRAWKTYEETPLPTTKLEEWRYTRVDQLGLEGVRLADVPAKQTGAAVPGLPEDLPQEARELLSEDRKASGRVLQLDDAILHTELDASLRDRGVILSDLATAASEHRELVEEHLARIVAPKSGKFHALNSALWSAGVFLYVPRGVRVELPIRVGRWVGQEGSVVFPRTLIIAGEGSSVSYVDEFGSPDFDEPTVSCGAVEVYAGEGAQVQHVALQRFGRGMRHMSMQRTRAGRDSNLDTLVVNLGASVARVDLGASLEGPGSNSDMLGLYFADEDQHFDHNTRQDHVSDHANSDLLYKGALYDSARAVFRGIIKVHPGAQQTDAYQTNRNLLLSNRARADSLPNLEIEADDVRCSHGATIGHLDEEELFYLMSRGLGRSMAESLVIFGFLGEVLERLDLPGVVDELREAIQSKIAAHRD